MNARAMPSRSPAPSAIRPSWSGLGLIGEDGAVAVETIVALCPASVVSIWIDCSLSFSACRWLTRFCRCSDARVRDARQRCGCAAGLRSLMSFVSWSMVGCSAACAAM